MASEVTVWGLLQEVIDGALVSGGLDLGLMRVFDCDHGADGRYERFSGVRTACDILVSAHYRNCALPSILLTGMQPLPHKPDAGAHGSDRLIALLGWPGAVYLPYGFTRDQLIAAARKVVEGVKHPLPLWLLSSAAVLRVNAQVRHWLENRLRNAEAALNDFERAARGEIQLHWSYLEPVAAVSEEHQAMLDRLWALEAPAKQFAPRTAGLAPLKAAITGFETHWQTLEGARAALRLNEAQGKMESVAELVIHFNGVRETLSAAITASRNLDDEMMAG